MKIYLVIKNNKVLRRYETANGQSGIDASLQYEKITDYDDIIQIPEVQIYEGDDLRRYKDDWNLKTSDDVLKELGVDILENQILVLKDEGWKVSFNYIDTKLIKKDKSEIMTITELDKTPSDYPEYVIYDEDEDLTFKYWSGSNWTINEKEKDEYNIKIEIDNIHKEIDYELNVILKTIAIEKYIENQKVINADTRDTII